MASKLFSLFQNIKKIFLGNGAAQLIQFAFLPLSAFLYTPEQFGVFGVIQAYSTVITIFISLQLYVAIPFEKDSNELTTLIHLNFKCILVTTLIFLIIYSLFLTDLFSILTIFLASIAAITNSLRSLIVYSGDFSKLSVSYIIRALIIVIMQAALSASNSINGLIYGLLVGEIIYGILLQYFIKNSNSNSNFGLSFLYNSSIKQLFFKYRAFTFYGSILELTSVLIFYGPIIIFSYLFVESSNLIGQYSFISRFIWPPIILISTSCANALYFHLTKIDDFELKSLTLKFTKLSIILLLFIPFFAWLGEFLVNQFVTTENWNMIADFSYFVIVIALSFVASIYVRAIVRFKYLQKYQLLMDSIFLIAIVIMLYKQKNTNSINILEILKFYSISYFIYSIILIFSILVFIYRSEINKKINIKMD